MGDNSVVLMQFNCVVCYVNAIPWCGSWVRCLKWEMEARFGLIFFVCVSFTVPGYDIAEKCTKQYDLTFRLTGYNCVIYGAGMFYYKDKQELDRITFNYLPAGAGILIDTESHVKTISIDEGDLRLCSNVHAPSGVTVRVNNQECVTVSIFCRWQNIYNFSNLSYCFKYVWLFCLSFK